MLYVLWPALYHSSSVYRDVFCIINPRLVCSSTLTAQPCPHHQSLLNRSPHPHAHSLRSNPVHYTQNSTPITIPNMSYPFHPVPSPALGSLKAPLCPSVSSYIEGLFRRSTDNCTRNSIPRSCEVLVQPLNGANIRVYVGPEQRLSLHGYHISSFSDILKFRWRFCYLTGSTGLFCKIFSGPAFLGLRGTAV
jgi:hypothetical protein